MLAEGRGENTVARTLGRTQRRRKRKNFNEARGEKEEHDVIEAGGRNSIKAKKRLSQNPLVGWPTGFGHQRLLVNLARAIFKSREDTGLPLWV